MSELTAENVVLKIKSMPQSKRNKIPKDELLSLICQLPDEVPSMESFKELNNKVEGLINTCSFFQSQAVDNSACIRNLEKTVQSLQSNNAALHNDVACLNVEINSIQQYLRVDNVEVIGLPLPQENVSDADLLVKCFKDLDLEHELLKEDIDICHEVPSRRKDKKRVVIRKFMSRKSKLVVI